MTPHDREEACAEEWQRGWEWDAGWTPTDIERGPDGEDVIVWSNLLFDAGELTKHERDIARAARRRWKREELTPAELDAESDRWLQQLALLKGDLRAQDFTDQNEASLADGITYAEAQLEAITRQLRRFVRAGLTDKRSLNADFRAIKYVDLVGLAETLTGQRAVKSGRRHRIRCPFHDDTRPSLVIYPPGGGWWCPVCHRGGQDAASFCAEFFDCSQVEGLRWVETLAEGVRVA